MAGLQIEHEHEQEHEHDSASRFRPVARWLLRQSVALQQRVDPTPALVSGPGTLLLLRRMQPCLGVIEIALNTA